MEIFQLLASLFAGLACGCALLLFFELVQNIRMDVVPENGELEKKRLPILFYLFLPFASNMYPIIHQPVFDSARRKCREDLQAAGYDATLTPDKFIALRFLMAVVGIILAITCLVFSKLPLALLWLLLFVLYPSVWLKSVIRKRHLAILKALPNLLDLLTLSVEAGKDFLTALREIIERRDPDALGEEFARTLHEIQLGRSRQAALKEMGERVRQPDLVSVLNCIIQADELGVSIGQLLRIQGDQLRTKRFTRAEKLANEAPVKILFPVVVFIFPAVFLILMGPILSQAFNVLGK